MKDNELRERLYKGLVEATELKDGRTLPDGSLLLGWVAVAEWQAPDGGRWLSGFNGDINHGALTAWQQDGYLHHALHKMEMEYPDDEGSEFDV